MTHKIIAINLENILKKDENGKPIIKLTPLEKTVVHTPTKEVFDELMKVYEIGDWKWGNGEDLPTKINYWKVYELGTCVDIRERFGYDDEGFYRYIKHDIISTQKFYKIQKITPETLKEINIYFENKK